MPKDPKRAGRPSEKELERAILRRVKSGLTLGELIESLNAPDYEIARVVYRLREEGKIEMEDPDIPRNLWRYLFSTRATWFWVLTLIVVATLLTVAFGQEPPLLYLRYVLGSIFVLYLPGASLIELLYPKGDELTQLERLALSLGLSLALTPLVGLVLNYTPWGIRLAPILTSLSLLVLIFGFGAVYRKYGYHKLKLYTYGGRE